MKRQLMIPMALILGLAFAGGASAGDMGERRGPPSFAEIDTNADQLLSREELQAFMQDKVRKGGPKSRKGGGPEGRFERADTDGDGYLSADEFEAVTARMAERFRQRHHQHHHGEHDEEESLDDSTE